MHNILGVARASAVLAHLFRSGAESHGLNAVLGMPVVVSTLSPDMVPRDANGASPRLNLFLFRALPAIHFRQTGLPPRDASGNRVGAPPLTLDLHYLLTAYGQAEFQTELLIACALQTLNESPLPPDHLPDSEFPFAGSLPGSDTPAANPRYGRLAPSELSVQEMSGLWRSFGVPYRTSLPLTLSMTITGDR